MSDLHRVTNHRPRTNNSGWSIFSKFFITTPSLLFSLVLHKSLTHWLLWELQPASQNAPNEWSGSIWLWKHRKSTNSGWTSHVQAPSPFLGGLFLETEAFVASYSNSSGNVNKAINLEDRESNAFSKPCIERKSISAICLARIPDPCVRLTEQRMSISTGL